jgi:hypothetical protein
MLMRETSRWEQQIRKEGRKTIGRNTGTVGRQRKMQRLGCQITCFKWKHLRRMKK